MDNFDSYNVLLVIATNIPVLLMTAFVLQGHSYAIMHQINAFFCTIMMIFARHDDALKHKNCTSVIRAESADVCLLFSQILKPSEKKAKYQYGGMNSGRPVTPPRTATPPKKR